MTEEKKVFVATFGCQMNEYDSGRMIRLLRSQGYVETREASRADLIFLNTCSIRDKAQQKVYSLLGRLRPLKEDNPNLILAVGGCVAQQEGSRLLERVPYLDVVVGTHGLERLPEIISEVARTGKPVCSVGFDYGLERLAPIPAPHPAPTGLKAFLTIMQGCDNYCAYCVVPYVRGREISRPLEAVKSEARELLASGVKEISLLGQNVNSYGRGLEPRVTFVDLLNELRALPGLLRLRFTTNHPKDLSPELIRTLAESGPVAEHIHLPVQSGSTAVLRAMRRGYTREDYLGLVQALRLANPEVAITTDMIVGFPGETEDNFQETISLARLVRFDGMYSFKYSDRPQTRASDLPDKVSEEIKGRRLAELQELQKTITVERNRELIGRRVEVMVEGRSGRYAGQLTGRTRTNKIVHFDGPEVLIGTLVHPLIVEAWANCLRGTLAEPTGSML